MAVGDFCYRSHKGHIEPSLAHLKDRIACPTIEQLQLHTRPLFPITVQQFPQKAGSDRCWHTDADASNGSITDHTGGLHRIDRLAERPPDLFDKYLYVGATRAATYLGLTSEESLPLTLSPLEELFGPNWL